ncbi:MAG: GGDEF domain-containing protein [Myxococcales bacterium]|nr:GGDEF domain-containing protein [Myxococcales bacterium]
MATPFRHDLPVDLGEIGGPIIAIPRDALRARLAHLESENRSLRQEIDRLAMFRRLAYRDDLTGLYNRRHFTERLTQEWSRASRFGEPLAVILIDVDKFKPINDAAGHEAGDHVLCFVARQMTLVCRSFDVPCRIGGDEFAYILPSSSTEGAEVLASRLIDALLSASERPSLPAGLDIQISVGIAERLDANSAADLVKRADAAMYTHKRSDKAICAA